MEEKREKLVYTVAEIAELMGVGITTAYDITHIKGFPRLKTGKRRIIIPKAAFHKWLNDFEGGGGF